MIIQKSIDFFKQISKNKDVSVLYIMRCEKSMEKGTIFNTLQLKNNTISVLHCPFSEGSKATQLNYAINHILSHSNKPTYFGLYDIDSQPDFRGIEAVLDGDDSVYQQPSLDVENYARITPFQQAGALQQIRWELGRNLSVLRHNSNNSMPKSLQNAIGHGLFIRSDVLKDVGMFREGITEDTEFGYRLAFHGIEITPLPYADYVQYNPSTLKNIPQISRWYSGESHLLSYYHKAPKSIRMTLLVSKRFMTTLKWAFGPCILSISYIVLILQYPVFALLLPVSIYLYIYKPFALITHSSVCKKFINYKQPALVTIFGAIRPFFNSLGPLYFYYTAVKNQIHGTKQEFLVSPKN